MYNNDLWWEGTLFARNIITQPQHLCEHKLLPQHNFLHVVIHTDKLYICTNFILTLALQTPAVHLFNMHSCNTYKFNLYSLVWFQ